MKKFTVLLSAFAVLATGAFAQTKKATPSNIRFGVNAGLTFPTMATYDETSNTTTYFGSNTSFFIGGNASMDVCKMISVDAGLSLVNKGLTTKKNYGIFSNDYRTVRTSITYLEVPVNVRAGFNIGSGKFLIGAGPYVGFALSGKDKGYTYDLSGDIVSKTTDITFGSGKTEMKSVDFGMNFSLAYKLSNGLGIQAGYGCGLIDLNNNDGTTTKNKVTSIGLNYTF